jgi:GNAT superfamily N-acetyltransferase
MLKVELTVRDAQISDAPDLANLMGVLGYPTTEAQMRNRLDKILSDSSFRTFVAEVGNRVVGFIGVQRSVLYETDEDLLRVCAISVMPAYQQSGVGRRLMEAAEAWARACGCTKVTLTSGNQRVHTAHPFYRKLGYEQTGVRFVKTLNLRLDGVR